MSTSSQPGALDDDPGNSVKAHRDGGFSSSSDSDGPRWSLAIGVLTPVAEPADFIEQLSIQVLACIPLDSSISTEEVADLVCVPETQLIRVVRMTATAGFLHEPQPGHISHTALLTSFVTNLAYLDAAMFLAETAAPAALHMADATRRHYGQNQTGYLAAFPASQTFLSACMETTKLQRQWLAYRQCVDDVDDAVTELLGRLKWRSLGNASVALAETHPSLRFIVQMIDSQADCNGDNDIFGGRISVQNRAPATTQVVKNAAVYIVRLTSRFTPFPAQILDELNAHFDVLRTNSSATLVLALSLLPGPKDFGTAVEAKARMRDLYRLQLTQI
ncbi:uncharacterized protein VB005_08161 [Metarhizium brunneum]